MLYLREAWTVLASEQMPLLPPLADFAEVENRVLGAGSNAVLAMWARVGLTFDEFEDDRFYIHVAAPLRP